MTAQQWDAELGHFRSWLIASGQSPHTIKLRVYYLSRFAAGCPGPWDAALDDLIEFLATDTWSPETRKSARASLRSFYRWGVLAGRVDLDPTRHLPPIRVPHGTARPTPERVLSQALAVATDRDRLMLMFGAMAGMRRSEIAATRFEDVAELVFVRGKGGRERMVPTHQRLRLAVEHEHQLRLAGTFGTGYRYGDPTTPYVFPGQSGGHITPGAVGKILARVLTSHSGHTLRHRFAGRAHEETGDLQVVRTLLGHSSLVTTQRYVPVSSTAMRAAVAAA